MDGLVALLSNNESSQAVADYAVKNADRLVSDWSYAANTSNHSSFGTYTIALATVLETSEFPEQNAVQVCRKIVTDEMKTIYRALTLAKPAQTVPSLKLLTQMARLCSAEVLSSFDFTLSVIRKLLSQAPFRNQFLLFYLTLIEHTSGPNRRELISNRKVVSAWFSKLGIEDTPELVHRTLKTLTQFVLKDTSNFTKSAKMGIFNDWTLKNFVRIMASLQTPPEIIEEIGRFIVMLLCDSHYGVKMSNGEHKLALSFLKIVKPWETVGQMDLVIKILREMPDIYADYFDQLGQAYSLAPKATMFYTAFTVLHIRALKLPFATDLTEIKDIARYVLPSTITRPSLQQALQSETLLIRFQAAQIILFALRRLRSVENELVTAEVLQNIPDPALFAKEANPPLLQTLYYAILNEMCQLRPVAVSSSGINEQDQEVFGLKLVQMENLLEIQTYTGDQTKWWNPAKNNKFSLFTQLARFATFNPKLAEKSVELLKHLTQPTQLFADIETLAHPVEALLFTLVQCHCDLTWELIEQAVQRATKLPYQYIDKVNRADVSPFLVALTEQYFSFFQSKDTGGLTKKWLNLFAHSLIVLGENQPVITELLSPISVELKADDEFFNFVLHASDKKILERKDLVFKISNNLEIAATLYRACHGSDLVRNHLLASIPADILSVLASKPAAFMQFVTGTKLIVQSFLVTIDGYSSLELGTALEKYNWKLGIPLLSTEFLLKKITFRDHSSDVLSELTARGVQCPKDLIKELLNVPGLANNLKLFPTHSDKNFAKFLAEVSDPALAAELVRISGMYSTDLKLAHDPLVLVSAAVYAREQLDHKAALTAAYNLLKQDDPSGLSVIVSLKPESVDFDNIGEFIESCKAKHSSLLLDNLVSLSVYSPPFLSRWLKSVVHQLTKRFSEDKMGTLEHQFVVSITNTTLGAVNLWQHVNHNEINGLIESILRNPGRCESSSFDLIAKISSQSVEGGVPTRLTSLSHVSMYMETTQSTPSSCSLAEVHALQSLITANPDSCSTVSIELGLLSRYNGSLVVKDKLLLRILEQIEAVRQRSFVDNVESWDVRPANTNLSIDDYDYDPLFVAKSSSLFVTLDEARITATVQQFEATILELNDLERYELSIPSNAEVLYDSEFLLSLIVSCDYLYENMEVFLTSGLLSFVLCCLSSTRLRDVALSVLKHAFQSECQYKDQVSVHLLIGKILSMETAEIEQAPHVPAITGQLALVLARPSHFLYSAATKWLLSAPAASKFDIPLYKSIIDSHSDLKMRELVWLVNALKSGAVNEAAVQAYVRSGVVEWCLSQYRQLNSRGLVLKEAITKFMQRVEEIQNGSRTLILTSGGLAVPEFKKRLVYTGGSEVVREFAN